MSYRSDQRSNRSYRSNTPKGDGRNHTRISSKDRRKNNLKNNESNQYRSARKQGEIKENKSFNQQEFSYARKADQRRNRPSNLDQNSYKLRRRSTNMVVTANQKGSFRSERKVNLSSGEVNNETRYNQRTESRLILENVDVGKELPNDILWGIHSTKAALETGRPIHRIWCTAEIRNSQKFLQLLRDAKLTGVLIEEVTWARLGQLTKGAVHQGIAIQTAAAETLNLKTLIDACDSLDETPLLVALDGLKDPQNLGAIVRSAEAMGAHGVVIPQRRSAGLTGSVAKVAAGALEHLPVARVVNLNRSLEQLKDAGYRIVGLAEEGEVTLPDADLEGPLVVVTGSEDKGISLVTRRHCDQLIKIPLRGATTSLNASVATALLLYEVARNSWMKGLKGSAPSPKTIRAKVSKENDSKIN